MFAQPPSSAQDRRTTGTGARKALRSSVIFPITLPVADVPSTCARLGDAFDQSQYLVPGGNAGHAMRKLSAIPGAVKEKDGDGHGRRGDRHVQFVLDQKVQTTLADDPWFVGPGRLAVSMNQLLEQVCDPGTFQESPRVIPMRPQSTGHDGQSVAGVGEGTHRLDGLGVGWASSQEVGRLQLCEEGLRLGRGDIGISVEDLPGGVFNSHLSVEETPKRLQVPWQRLYQDVIHIHADANRCHQTQMCCDGVTAAPAARPRRSGIGKCLGTPRARLAG